MNENIIPLFSSPLYETCLNINEVDFNKFLSFVKSLEYSKCYDDYGTENNGYISNNLDILNSENLLPLKKIIDNELNNFLYNYLQLDGKIKIENICSWATKHSYGDKCHHHNHSNSVFSGVFYLQVPEFSGEELIFHNFNRSFPPLYPKMDFKNFNYLNSNEWRVKVESKKLLLFPSNLVHSVVPSKSYEDRFCISFNYILRGNSGYPTCYASF